MKVILLQEVKELGKAGDVKMVSDGYARNFLIPRSLAELATASNIKTFANRMASKAAEEEREKTKFENIAKKIQTLKLRFALKIGDKGRAFGSVTAQDIAGELAGHGFKIEKQWIDLEQPIKTTGEHSVKIKLPYQIMAEVRIVAKQEES